MAAMKENTRKIFDYLKEHDGENMTAVDVAETLGIDVRSVNGSFTSFQKKELGVREEVEVELEDGTHKKVKFLRLTAKGRAFDPDAATE